MRVNRDKARPQCCIDHPGDPAPPLPPATDWSGFVNFIQNHNNVTWRNFNVVDVDPDSDSNMIVLPFQIAGAPDRARVFGIEIMQHFRSKIKVQLQLPMMTAGPFVHDRNLEHSLERKKGIVNLRLPSMPCIDAPSIKLARGSRAKARLVIQFSKKQRIQPGNRIAIRQLYEGIEVGRVTWQFQNRKAPKRKD